MRIFSSIKSKALLVGATTVVTVAVAAGTALAGWGPDRPTFTWANPATYVTFNSITDNPVVGDERAFLSGKVTSDAGNVVDNIKVKDNDQVTLRVYFHNNARSDLNLVATNTRVSILLPKVAESHTFASSYISADNSNPKIVSDSVDFTGDRPFSLEYVPGSALLTNKVFTSGTKLSDDIITTKGALIGYNAIDGRVPGCGNFSGYVNIKVRVKMQPEQEKPAHSCDALKTTVSGRKVDAAVTYKVSGGATFKSATFDWGDGNKNTVNAVTASHTYGADGTYTINSTLTFNVGGTDRTSTCSEKVTITTPPQTPPTPPTIPVTGKTLPDTGAGGVIGLFAGVSTLAGAIHYVVGRRLGA